MRIDGLFHCHTGRHADGVRQGKVTMDFYFSDSAGRDGADVSVCDGGPAAARREFLVSRLSPRQGAATFARGLS